MEERNILVSVYGSLRQGGGNYNHYLGDAEYIGTFNTEPTFSLYSLGGFPGLKTGGDTSVVMEVYRVNEKEALAIDRLEGYSPNRTATFYDKINLDTPYGMSSVYTYVDKIPENRIVKSGDWINYLNQQSRSYIY